MVRKSILHRWLEYAPTETCYKILEALHNHHEVKSLQELKRLTGIHQEIIRRALKGGEKRYSKLPLLVYRYPKNTHRGKAQKLRLSILGTIFYHLLTKYKDDYTNPEFRTMLVLLYTGIREKPAESSITFVIKRLYYYSKEWHNFLRKEVFACPHCRDIIFSNSNYHHHHHLSPAASRTNTVSNNFSRKTERSEVRSNLVERREEGNTTEKKKERKDIMLLGKSGMRQGEMIRETIPREDQPSQTKLREEIRDLNWREEKNEKLGGERRGEQNSETKLEEKTKDPNWMREEDEKLGKNRDVEMKAAETMRYANWREEEKRPLQDVTTEDSLSEKLKGLRSGTEIALTLLKRLEENSKGETKTEQNERPEEKTPQKNQEKPIPKEKKEEKVSATETKSASENDIPEPYREFYRTFQRYKWGIHSVALQFQHENPEDPAIPNGFYMYKTQWILAKLFYMTYQWVAMSRERGLRPEVFPPYTPSRAELAEYQGLAFFLLTERDTKVRHSYLTQWGKEVTRYFLAVLDPVLREDCGINIEKEDFLSFRTFLKYKHRINQMFLA